MAATALLWAVHDEFLRYMARIEDGQVAVVDGAEQLPGGGFRFPVMDDAGAAERSAGHDARRGNSTRFRGAVVCTGHHEMLTVTIAAPELLRQEGAMALVIDDPFSPGERMPMAHLRPSSQDPRQFLDGRLRRGSLELLPYLGRCTDWHGWKRIDAAERQGATARRVRAKLHNAREQRLLAAAALLNPTDAAAPTRTRRASSEGLPRLSIVFGTESGNAELVAEELGAALSEHLDVTVRDIASLDRHDPASALELEVPHLMICSTYGDGELPVSARPFCQALREQAPSLEGLRYAVFGLGDHSYHATYSRGGEILDETLRACGAQRVGEFGRHDAAAAIPPHDAARAWAQGALEELTGVALS